MRAVGYAIEETLDGKRDMWLEEIRSRMAPRQNLRWEISRSALLVIDMLCYFAHPSGRCYLPAAAPIIPRIGRLIELFRERGRPILFTRHAHESNEDLGMLGKFFSDHIRLGEPDAMLIPEFKPLSGEPVLRKTTYDAFWGTDMMERLHGKGVEQVLITGVLTHMCCETTARSAFCRGFEVYVPVDGVASSSEERHLGSLQGMAECVAVVTSVDEVLETCAGKR